MKCHNNYLQMDFIEHQKIVMIDTEMWQNMMKTMKTAMNKQEWKYK